MIRKEPAFRLKPYRIIIVILLLVNTALVVWALYLLQGMFPSSATRFGYKQEVAQDLAAYNQRLATDLNVLDRKEVKEALATFNYDIAMASTSDELTQVILNHGRRVQEIILREAENKLLDQLLAVVNQDANVRAIVDRTYLKVNVTDQEITTVPNGILLPATISQMEQLLPPDRALSQQSIDIEIAEGVGRFAVPYNPVEHIQSLSDELDALRVKHHELRVAAGLAEMSGEGIVIHLYDKVGGTTTASIIHDTDIRDVVNELFASGAQGVSVGGERLIVTSSIRCTGPLIKVNDKLISVNPVEIQAVGDPNLLVSGLDIIRSTMELKRGLRFEITRSDSLQLPAYARSSQ
jgi:hypothetical protein